MIEEDGSSIIQIIQEYFFRKKLFSIPISLFHFQLKIHPPSSIHLSILHYFCFDNSNYYGAIAIHSTKNFFK